MRLSRSEKRLIALLLAACAVLAVLTLRRPQSPPDPRRQPTDLYPHVNASDTFRVDPSWPAPTPDVPAGEITGVAVAPDDSVWVLGLTRPPVRLYDPRGQFVRGWGADQIVFGHQIRVDPQGFVWVADAGGHCVHKFRPDGTRVLTLGTPGAPGEDATHFNEPTDVAVTANGDVFVADGYVNARVVHFRADGTFVNTWGTRGSRPGQFSLVHAIVADGRGRVLVADRNNARVQVFNPDGRFLSQWANVVIPWGLSAGPRDEVWVCGSSPAAWQEDARALANPPHDQLLMRFDPDGRLLQLWAIPLGERPGESNEAHAVAADSHGNLYCADYRGKRIQRFLRVPATEGTNSP